MNPESIKALLYEADLYASQGLISEARQLYEELLAKAVNYPPPLATTIKQRLEALTGTRTQAVSANGRNRPAHDETDRHLQNAIGLMEAGFHREAVSELKLILDKGYPNGEIHLMIAEAYLASNLPFDAVDHLGEALKDTKLSPEKRMECLYRAAIIHEQLGMIPQAIEKLRQIVRIDPGYRNCRERLDGLTQSAQKFGQYYPLIAKNLLQESQLEEARSAARAGGKTIESILMTRFSIEKEEIGRALSEYYRVPFIEFNELEVGTAPACIKGVKEHFFRANTCVPIKEERDVLLVALDNPNDLVKIDNIKRVLKASQFEFAVALKEDIDKFIDFYFGKLSLGGKQGNVFDQLEISEGEEVETDDEASDASEADSVVVQMANTIIEDAFAKNASDIHIESLTGRRGAGIRLRIDGDCIHYQNVPYEYKHALISRIKIMSSLDIAEKRLPQDGKIKFKTRQGKTIELRVATLPTIEGNEDVVLRILSASEAMPLDKIGLMPDNLAALKDILAMPYGLILVVGPTGSGKTTTLHAALGHINRPEKKIWTAEDPVEIVQEGLRQVQVKPAIGLTFARVLRAFLRADPDVIMVGETRDEETATTVIEASLTGHLVFSTLHTNSAPETVTRLLGMGMDPFNFSDALLGILAQRLVKRLCTKCKEPYTPDKDEIQRLITEYGSHPSRPLDPSRFASATLYRAKGCPFCNNTGYKGRLAIHELLISNDELKRLIQEKRPVYEIADAALRAGMLTLKQDGILKILSGDTDIKQVRSACIK
ncbi:MAG: Flp pilus assembly complex ATPase component TadA [Deltaproteobacteria bacterium]